MEQLKIVSSDDHLQETPDLWEKRVPEHLRDKAPRLIELPDGAGHAWQVADGPPRPMGLDVMAGRKYEEYKAFGVRFEEIRPGCYDPMERLKDLDIGGIYATVLYPNVMLGVVTGLTPIADPELAQACIRAYNDHLSEFCSEDPDRLIGNAVAPMHSLEASAEEIKRVGKLPGIRGILLPIYPGPEEQWNNTKYEPLWAAAADAGLTISIHIGLPRGLSYQSLFGGQGGPEAIINLAPLSVTEPLAFILWSGVFDRYPDLKLVTVESGIGWVAYFRERAENVYKRHRYWTHSALKNPPGYYFGRNLFATFEEDITGVQTRNLAGVEALLWSSDYPHTDTSWPNCLANIEEHFEGVLDEDKRKVVSENAARVYGLSLS